MILLLALSIGLVALASTPSDAASLTPAFSPANGISSGGPASIYISASTGVNFTPQSDLLVEAIGAYDTEGDSLTNRWEVAIYAAEPREQLRIALVPTEKTESTRVGEFRYIPIAPLRLTAGVVYQIASYNFGREENRQGVPGESSFNVGASADIEVIGAFWHNRVNLGHVSFAEYAHGIYRFGGSFLYRAIPEPTSLALVAMLAGCGLLRHRSNN
jgi:hypothetical protein